MEYYSSFSGRHYVLGKQSGRGGEATIFEIENYSGAVAKLYKPELCTSYKEEKLRTMLQTGIPAHLEEQIAYPKDILYRNGKFVGFVMRRVNGVPLNEIWDDESLDMEKRCTIAKNMTALLYSIHKEAGIVIGDLNPFNVLIDPVTGFVRLIDVDSWHISDQKSGKVFRCDVCIPEYSIVANSIPKGETLKTAPLPTFSMESDIFALALMLFQLIIDAHPFAVGVAKGNTTENVPQPTELMRNYQFPYIQEQCPTGYQIPIYSLPLKTLSYRLQNLFQKTFNGENVPIEHFFNALSAFEKELVNTCKKNTLHKYRKGLYSCPYCKVNKRKEAFFKALHKKS